MSGCLVRITMPVRRGKRAQGVRGDAGEGSLHTKKGDRT